MSIKELLDDRQEFLDQKILITNELKWVESQIKKIESKIYKVCKHTWDFENKCDHCQQYQQ